MAKKTNAGLTLELDKAVLKILELEAKLKKSARVEDTQAQAVAKALRPDVELLVAKFFPHGVLVAFYEDGKRTFDQDAVHRVQLKLDSAGTKEQE